MRKLSLLFYSIVLLLLVVGPAAAMSTSEEVRIGQQASSQLEAKYGISHDPVYVDRLQRIAARMRTHLKRQDLPWRFSVLNVNDFNAAAFPGGFVYATKGIMDGLSDNELAFVLGHEMGHVEERHSVKQLERSKLTKIGIFAILAGTGGGRVNDTTATLLGLADSVVNSQYSQADESQADRYALGLMASSGYDPAYGLATLEKLAAQGGKGMPGFLNTLLGSHPLPKERVAQAFRLIPDVPFAVQPVRPVTGGVKGQQSPASLIVDASRAMEYTLSLLGNGHSLPLQRATEAVLEGRGPVPKGTQMLRVVGKRSQGYSFLEDELLSRPELARPGKKAFGVAVGDEGNGVLEAVLLWK